MTEPIAEQQSSATNGAHPPQFVSKDSAYRAPSEATELIRTDAGDITATTVTLDRSGAEQITAERVTLERSGAKSITTKSSQLEQSGVLDLDAESVVLHKSNATNVRTKEARVVRSNILLFRSEHTTVEGKLRPLVHIGNACDNAKPIFNGSSAIRFGATLGAVLLIGGRIMRALFGSGRG